jgi:RNA polymerase sigma factor (sigma-70 family)
VVIVLARSEESLVTLQIAECTSLVIFKSVEGRQNLQLLRMNDTSNIKKSVYDPTLPRFLTAPHISWKAPAMTVPGSDLIDRPARRFATTRWSLILQARRSHDTTARVALEELCRTYWVPVYAFMRRQTPDVHDAQDLTQGLFTSLLTQDAFADLCPERGRFRAFLLAAARHYVSNARDHASALKRGGAVAFQSLDYDVCEQRIATDLDRSSSAEALFERHWALTLLEQVLLKLRQEFEAAGRAILFTALSGHLSEQEKSETLAELAGRLEMTPEAVRVALHRMRKRYRRILREEITQTIASPDEWEDEIRQLFRVLQR